MTDVNTILDVEIRCLQEAGIAAPKNVPTTILQELYPERIVLTSVVRGLLCQMSPRIPEAELLVQNLMEWGARNAGLHDGVFDLFWRIPAFARDKTIRSRYSSLYFNLRDSGFYNQALLNKVISDYPLFLHLASNIQRSYLDWNSCPASGAQKYFIAGMLTILLVDNINEVPSDLATRMDGLRAPTLAMVKEFAVDSARHRQLARETTEAA